MKKKKEQNKTPKQLIIREALNEFYKTKQFKELWAKKVEVRIKSALLNFVPREERHKYDELAQNLKDDISQMFHTDVIKEGYKVYRREKTSPPYNTYAPGYERPMSKNEAIIECINIDELEYVIDVLCKSLFEEFEMTLENSYPN